MSEARATIDLLLSQKRTALAAVEKQRSELLIEIRTLEGVLALLPVELEAGREENGRVEHRTRRPTKAWITLLRMASAQATQPFGYDDLMLAADLAGTDMKAPTLRARMMDYVRAGYVSRVDTGRFLLTRQGAQMIASASEELSQELPLGQVNGSEGTQNDETPDAATSDVSSSSVDLDDEIPW